MNNFFILKNSSKIEFKMPLPHTHVFFEMCIVEKGDRTFHIENTKIPLKKNELIVIPSNTFHRSEGGAFSVHLVHFERNFLDDFQSNLVAYMLNQKISMTDAEAERIFYITESIFDIQNDARKSNEEKDYFIKFLFFNLFFEISKLANFPKEKFVKNKDFSSRTKQIMSFIEDNYQKQITLESLSEQFFFSKTALNKDFKKCIGLSIMDYVLRKRLNASQELLLNTNKSISEIAEKCGFSSQSYFYLIFRKRIGMSPSTYRKRPKQ